MKAQSRGRREFLQETAGWGLLLVTGACLSPEVAEAQNNPPPPPPEPADTAWTATIVPAGEPGEPLVVEGHVYAPDGQHTVAGVVVYAYNTDKDGYYSLDGKVGHPRLKGYMKTDAEGRFELHTIRPRRYPGMHIPAHVHFNLWGAAYPVQWTEELRFEGDSYLTEKMKKESEEMGKFATIRPLTRDKNGVYQCEINLRLREKSNFKT
jgi:protocatechuate 3,4-dioxygenase beta subunit